MKELQGVTFFQKMTGNSENVQIKDICLAMVLAEMMTWMSMTLSSLPNSNGSRINTMLENRVKYIDIVLQQVLPPADCPIKTTTRHFLLDIRSAIQVVQAQYKPISIRELVNTIIDRGVGEYVSGVYGWLYLLLESSKP